MITATYIRNLDSWRGDARLYKLSEPIDYQENWNDDRTIKVEYLIVSAVDCYSGPETYIFPAKEDGEDISMLEMDGSFRGALDHKEALTNAGYILADSIIDIEYEEVKPLQLD